jgi:hypothetical protein
MTPRLIECSTFGKPLQLVGYLEATSADAEAVLLATGEPATQVSGVKMGRDVHLKNHLGTTTKSSLD